MRLDFPKKKNEKLIFRNLPGFLKIQLFEKYVLAMYRPVCVLL